jgi:hypothetical protein
VTKAWKPSTSAYKAALIAEASLRNLPIIPALRDEMDLRKSEARKTAWDNRFNR